MKWESRKLNIVPGVPRFQKVENAATKRVFFRLDIDQFNAIKYYCSQHSVTMTDLILSSIAAKFKAENFEPTGTPPEDPNQLKIKY
jgi:NRPS condensation-like uncharacterized protein